MAPSEKPKKFNVFYQKLSNKDTNIYQAALL